MERDALRSAALDPRQMALRADLAFYIAQVFESVGNELHVVGHIFGVDRREGLSPFGHGDDETVAASMLLRIGRELISATADLVASKRTYAGSALIRQLVEIEYLAYAFATRNGDALRWLRSSKEERHQFFSPGKLRAASNGHFRGVDYGYHCELGGHPVPTSWMLLNDDGSAGQLMLSDALGHTAEIWDHLVEWARRHENGNHILRRSREMVARYTEWKASDALTRLPPLPDGLQE